MCSFPLILNRKGKLSRATEYSLFSAYLQFITGLLSNPVTKKNFQKLKSMASNKSKSFAIHGNIDCDIVWIPDLTSMILASSASKY